MKELLFLVFAILLTCCSSTQETSKLVRLQEEINVTYEFINLSDSPLAKANAKVAMNAYNEHISLLDTIIYYHNNTEKDITDQLYNLHRHSITVQDSLILASHAISYGCIRGNCVIPKPNTPVKEGDDWAHQMTSTLDSIEIDSFLHNWKVQNLEWQEVVLDMIKNTFIQLDTALGS